MIDIYALADEIGQVRYVGQSRDAGKRFWWHKRAAIKHYAHATGRVYNWLRSVIERGAEPVLLVLETCEFEVADGREIWWIAHYRALGMDLVNHTLGGGGMRGWKHTDVAKRKIGDRHRGKVVSEAARRNISAAQTGKTISHTHRQSLLRAAVGRVKSEAERAAISSRQRGNQHGKGTKHPVSVVRARACKVSGERNTKAKATDAMADEIRAKCAAGKRQCDLADEYGVTRVTVHRIVAMKTYRRS